MSYTTIDTSSDYFNTVLYTGNFSTQSITGVGFQPDWVWIKERSVTGNHQLQNSVNGTNSKLMSNSTSAEGTDTNYITSFDSDGFSLGANNGNNQSGVAHVAWNWLAGGSASSNTNGSITSSVSANTTSGFSVVAFAGTGSNATVGHGLSSAPKVIILKNRDAGDSWIVGHDSIAFTKFIKLDENGGSGDGDFFNDTAPTSSVFSVGTQDDVNASSENIVAFCFSEVKGFSKFGKFTGNGSTDGSFVYTGFKPAWVMCKRTDSTGSWYICDNKRLGFNGRPNNSATVGNVELAAHSTRSEAAGNTNVMDIFSNGFQLISSGAEINGSGASFIYMAFAEAPFVSSGGVPTTARG